MHPANFAKHEFSRHVETGVLALKVKLLTNGTVTLHTSHLLSPGGVAILNSHPDLIECSSILPAFRVDKQSIDEYVTDHAESYRAFDVTEKDVQRVVDHLSRNMKRVMPWDLGDVAQRYQARLLEGIGDETSLVHRQLLATGAFGAKECESIQEGIRSVDPSEDGAMSRYLDALGEPLRDTLTRFERAVYHQIGTQVVNCETGYDLSPLSRFTMASEAASGVDPTRVFLNSFFATALEAIDSEAVPASVMETLHFSDIDRISLRLREASFQERYDELTSKALSSLGADAKSAIEALEFDRICDLVDALDSQFEAAIAAEAPHLLSQHEQDAKSGFLGSATSLAHSVAGVVPGVGNIASAYAIAKDYKAFIDSAGRAALFRGNADSMEVARTMKREEIANLISTLPLSSTSKARLLDAASFLLEIHVRRVTRA